MIQHGDDSQRPRPHCCRRAGIRRRLLDTRCQGWRAWRGLDAASPRAGGDRSRAHWRGHERHRLVLLGRRSRGL